jgi:uncharacterized repeat protein (TIGR01451 family)
LRRPIEPGLFLSTSSGNTNVFVARLRLADMAVTGRVAARGRVLTYELTVSNGGPDDAERVGLALLLPEGATFVGATTTAGTCGATQPRVVTCTLGDAGTGVVSDVTVTATAPPPPSSPLEAGALVASATYEGDADDNMVALTSN